MTSLRQKRRKYRKWRLKNPDAPRYRIVEYGVDFIDRHSDRRIIRMMRKFNSIPDDHPLLAQMRAAMEASEL